jgi:putative transposase
MSAGVPDTSISGLRVARELDRLIVDRGKPKMIVSDNGTELTFERHAAMGGPSQGRLALHRAGKLAQHAFAESFIGRLRDELLNETAGSALGRCWDTRLAGRLTICWPSIN